MDSAREKKKEVFLIKYNYNQFERELIAGDASFRKYERIFLDSNKTLILMDAPPNFEKIKPFIRIAKYLLQLGFSVPEIYQYDDMNGFMLLEDLGDNTYTRLLEQKYDEEKLYSIATSVLIKIHKSVKKESMPEFVNPFSSKRIINEVCLFHEWYFSLIKKKATYTIIQEYINIWNKLIRVSAEFKSSLILFDYHVDNLLLLDNRPSYKACGLLDFQDATYGPITYDLMSLLEDARRSVNPEIVIKMKSKYLDSFPEMNKDDFETSWAIMSAQRHLRVLGTFARLKIRDKKSQYLIHILRIWKYLEISLNHPVLEELKLWLDENLKPEERIYND